MPAIYRFGNDVDTDQIIASQYIILPNVDEMKTHAFESLDPAFVQRVRPGDILVAGQNFGCGSSREQAPAVLKALGVGAVVAKSFARIFYRNAINIGLPAFVCAGIDAAADGDEAELDMEKGELRLAGGEVLACTKLPPHMRRILESGGLVAWLNSGEGV